MTKSVLSIALVSLVSALGCGLQVADPATDGTDVTVDCGDDCDCGAAGAPSVEPGTGGSQATGGQQATGGSQATGGNTATGGQQATGGGATESCDIDYPDPVTSLGGRKISVSPYYLAAGYATTSVSVVVNYDWTRVQTATKVGDRWEVSVPEAFAGNSSGEIHLQYIDLAGATSDPGAVHFANFGKDQPRVKCLLSQSKAANVWCNVSEAEISGKFLLAGCDICVKPSPQGFVPCGNLGGVPLK